MSFLEHIGNSLTSIQPWREFPPGHPRHGESLSAERTQFGIKVCQERSSERSSVAAHKSPSVVLLPNVHVLVMKSFGLLPLLVNTAFR